MLSDNDVVFVTNPEACEMFRVLDMSMDTGDPETSILAGDILIIDKSRTVAGEGIFAVVAEERLYARRVHVGRRGLDLISADRCALGAGTRIVGRVAGLLRRLDMD